MTFLQETGLILSPEKDTIHIIDGYPGYVEFPGEFIWDLHKKKPGIVYCLCHTHPPGFIELSGEDMTTLQAWARSLYPFPIRMAVVAQQNHHTFATAVYVAMWESLQEWKNKGKRPEGREVKVFKEKIKLFTFPQEYVPEGLSPDEFQEYFRKERKKARITSWEALILKKSYKV